MSDDDWVQKILDKSTIEATDDGRVRYLEGFARGMRHAAEKMNQLEPIAVSRSQRNIHIVGKCWHCGEEHDGVLALSVRNSPRYGPILELGIEDNKMFHPLETISLTELLDSLKK
jgi:hypothetical protein